MDEAAAIHILEFLVEKYPAAVWHADNDGSLPIHLATPDSIRCIDNYGWSPRHVLCGIAEVDGVNGAVLESIRAWAFNSCRYLEWCVKLNHVDLVGVGGVHETVVLLGQLSFSPIKKTKKGASADEAEALDLDR
eukprot:scaffold9210_cov80-Skeletonema_menzelii.AAC.1